MCWIWRCTVRDMNKLDPHEQAFLGVLEAEEAYDPKRIGRPDMAGRIDATPREVQNVYDRLVFDHHVPILSYDGKGGGYCFPPQLDAAAKEAIGRVCKRMVRRAYRQLYHQSILKRSSFAEEAVQMQLGFAEEFKRQEAARQGSADLGITVPDDMNVVKQVFKEVAEHPEKYTDELDFARKHIGGILLTNEMAEKLVKARDFLNALIAPKPAA